MKKIMSIPVVDLFAGPGGLGEGFSAYQLEDGKHPFKVILSIEKEESAYKTLKLRAFFREFDEEEVPEEYYQCLRGELKTDELYDLYPAQSIQAARIAWKAELGGNRHKEVDQRINDALEGSKTWILIGGPPCQAYSIVGRSRMARVWEDRPEEKEMDHRHFLYREYLRIIKKHSPPVFIMENVRGMLSSQISEGMISDLIIDDLHKLGYRLYSFVKHQGKEIDKSNPRDFIVQCEKYGIPQARHRVIIFGIRKDIMSVPEILEPRPEVIALKEVIGNLPKIRSGLSKDNNTTKAWISALKLLNSNGMFSDVNLDASVRRKVRRQLESFSDGIERGGEFVKSKSRGPQFENKWYHDSRLKGVCNHSSRGHIIEDLHRYLFASCFAQAMKRSPRLVDFPEELLPKHKNIQEGLEGKFADRFRVQLAGQPSTTITSHISKDGHYFIHPDPKQCRSLTVREAARLQTFPDNYFFVVNQTFHYVLVVYAVLLLLSCKLSEKVF